MYYWLLSLWTAVFSIMSKEFRQYTTLLSMLDFSYYDLLMAIGVTFPLITGGVDLSIGTGMVCYALIAGTMVRSHGWPVAAMVLCPVLGLIIGAPEWCAHRCYEPATVPCNSLYMCDHPWCWFSLQCNTMAGAYRMVDGSTNLQDHSWFREEVLPVTQSDSCGWFFWFCWMEFVLNHTKFGRYTIAIGSNKRSSSSFWNQC